MTETPRVTVVVPAYNVAPFIADAISSLKRQTLSAFTALVIDDGSEDRTVAAAETAIGSDSRFHILKHEHQGLAATRNLGVRNATTPYIAFLDSDDRFRPQKLESHVGCLDRRDDAVLAYAPSRVIKEDGSATFVVLRGRPKSSNPVISLAFKNFIGHGSNAVIRRSAFERAGLFDETLPSSEDLDLWLRIASVRLGSFVRLPEISTDYRVRPGTLTADLEQMRCCHERVLRAALARDPDLISPIFSTAIAYQYRMLARLAWTAGNAHEGKRFLHLALEHDRSIFWRDYPSFLTLLLTRTAPLSFRLFRNCLYAGAA